MTPLPSRLTRAGVLCLLAGAIIGIGCATIRVAAPPEKTGTDVWQPAAQRGDAVAQLQMALAYLAGSAGLPQDNAKALQYLGMAADNGNVDAQMILADASLKGTLGAPRDPQHARALLEQAAAHSPLAALRLADLLKAGVYLPKDTHQAAHWYEQSARAGNHFAAWRLAQLQETLPDGKVLAYAWYSASGNPDDAARVLKTLAPAQQSAAQQQARRLQQELKP